jgi:hypothetical protein
LGHTGRMSLERVLVLVVLVLLICWIILLIT